jgi:ESS family glutamate:Na+ symporter
VEVVTVLWDFVIMSIFLILGYVIREKIVLFQKLFIPSSVIGGILMLIAGPQVLGIIEIPKTISQYPGVLIIIILAALVLGIKIDNNKIKSYFDYSTVLLITYGALLFFGVGIEIVLGFVWNDLPPGWGLLGVIVST